MAKSGWFGQTQTGHHLASMRFNPPRQYGAHDQHDSQGSSVIDARLQQTQTITASNDSRRDVNAICFSSLVASIMHWHLRHGQTF
jgi:hypothetical protein